MSERRRTPRPTPTPTPTPTPAPGAARLLGYGLIAWACFGCAATGPVPDGAGTPAAAPAEEGGLAPLPEPFTGLHPLARAVADAGAPACARKVAEAAYFLTEGSSATAFWNIRSEQLLSFSLEVLSPEGLTSYVSLDVLPGDDDECVIAYDMVMHWPNDCEAVARHAYGPGRPADSQPANMTMLRGPDGEHVFLMPVQGGCVSVQKEVFP